MYKTDAKVTIDADVGTVWSYISDSQNFPRFLSHIAQIEMLGEQTSRWTLRGPTGFPVIWKVVSRISPAREIAWQSIEGAIKTIGSITTDPVDQGTCVTIHLEYTPPGGSIGQAFARLFKNPQQSLEQDLLRLKQIIETNEAQGRDKVAPATAKPSLSKTPETDPALASESATANPLESEIVKKGEQG